MKRRSFLKQKALSAPALPLSSNEVFGARKKETDYESKVPKENTSANTLAEQEQQLRNNPLVERFRP